MDEKHERPFFRRIEAGRFQDPHLHRRVARSFDHDRLRARQIELLQESIVSSAHHRRNFEIAGFAHGVERAPVNDDRRREIHARTQHGQAFTITGDR